jgi:hypothetical protein
MEFNPKALLVLVGFGALLSIAVSSNGGPWFHVGEAATTIVIAAALAGLLNGSRRVR